MCLRSVPVHSSCAMCLCSLQCACAVCSLPVQSAVCLCSPQCGSLQCACAFCRMPVQSAVCLCSLSCACLVCLSILLVQYACAVCSMPVQLADTRCLSICWVLSVGNYVPALYTLILDTVASSRGALPYPTGRPKPSRNMLGRLCSSAHRSSSPRGPCQQMVSTEFF